MLGRLLLRRGILASVASLALLALMSAGCLPSRGGESHAVLTADVLDSIDAALDRLAADRWPTWSMRVEGGRVALEVDVADTPASEACRDIAIALRESAGDAVLWSADLTRAGAPLAHCAGTGPALPAIAARGSAAAIHS